MEGLSRGVVVGEWYRSGAEPPFEVVAVDADQETIEIQYFDGTVQEIDFDSWEQMDVQPSVPPEDWSGAMDLGKEDYGVDIDVQPGDSWNSPLDRIDRMN
jgi:hypothetical protein